MFYAQSITCFMQKTIMLLFIYSNDFIYLLVYLLLLNKSKHRSLTSLSQYGYLKINCPDIDAEKLSDLPVI